MRRAPRSVVVEAEMSWIKLNYYTRTVTKRSRPYVFANLFSGARCGSQAKKAILLAPEARPETRLALRTIQELLRDISSARRTHGMPTISAPLAARESGIGALAAHLPVAPTKGNRYRHIARALGGALTYAPMCLNGTDTDDGIDHRNGGTADSHGARARARASRQGKRRSVVPRESRDVRADERWGGRYRPRRRVVGRYLDVKARGLFDANENRHRVAIQRSRYASIDGEPLSAGMTSRAKNRIPSSGGIG